MLRVLSAKSPVDNALSTSKNLTGAVFQIGPVLRFIRRLRVNFTTIFGVHFLQ